MRPSLQPEPPRAARGLRPAWDQRGRARCGGPSSVPHGRAGQAWSSCSRISAWEEMWSWGLGGRGVPAWMWGWLRPERRVARPAPGPRAAPCLDAWRGGRMVVSGVRGRGLRAAGEPATCGRLEPLPSCGPPGGPGVVGFPRLAFPVCAPSGFWAPLPRQVSPGTGLPGPAPPAQLILRELLVKLMVPQLPSVSRRPAPRRSSVQGLPAGSLSCRSAAPLALALEEPACGLGSRPGRPSGCSGDGPGSPLPSPGSARRLRGGGRSLAGLSQVCGWRKRRPSAWERLLRLTCFQSCSYRGWGWEGGEGGGLNQNPSPRLCLQEPRPRGGRLPWRRTHQWWPRQLWTLDSQCPVPPTPGSADGRQGPDRGVTRPRRRRGPFGDGGHSSHSAPGL